MTSGTIPLRQPARVRRGPLAEALRRLLRHRMAIIGGVILFGLIASAILASILAPQNPLAVDLTRTLLPGFWDPKGSRQYPLGTDELGRDVLSRVLFGGRVSLFAGVATTGLATLTGLAIGSIALFSSRADTVAVRSLDILFAFPPLLLAMAIVAVLGPGLFNAVLAITLVDMPRVARVVRGQMLAVKAQEYIEAARAIGVSGRRLLFRHALPNVLPVVIVYASLLVGRAILTIAGLGFLGLGARPPTPEWGAMLSESRGLMVLGAWLPVALPGVAILLSVLGFNLLGDALRDSLDPRLQ